MKPYLNRSLRLLGSGLMLLGACSSTPPSTTSSSSGGTAGTDAGLAACPALLSGCFAYACTCKNGNTHPQVAGVSPSGVCESVAEACERTCSVEQGVAAVACGAAPALKDAAPDVTPHPQCMAGLCNYFAEATCKGGGTFRLDSECPDTGICPTVAEAAEAKCADRGGVASFTP